MNIRKEVLDYGSKDQVVKVANFIGSDEKKFAELMNLFFSPNNLHAHRASWVMSHVTDKYPWMINPYLDKLVKNLFNSPGDAIKRNTIRIFQSIEIPEEF